MKAVPAMRLPIGAVMAAALVALAQPGASAAMTEPGHGTARGYAGDLAQAAAKESGIILERRRLAQAEVPKPDAGAAAKQDSEIPTPLRWFHRSSREFQMLMRMLAEGVPPPQPWDPVADAEKRAAAQKADKQQARPPDNAADAKRVAEAKAAEERSASEAKATEERKAAEAKRVAAEARTPPASATDRRKDRAEHLKCRGAGETIRAPGWYVVRERDTLSAIAWRHYGAARCYLRIHAANRRRIRNPHLIYPCQRIYLPRPLRRC